MTDLPPGWEWATLEDLAGPMARAITDGPFGSNLKSEHYTESGARVIRLQNIGDGHFRDERTYIEMERFEALRAHEVREGDLIVASLGDTPPRACLVPALGRPAIVKADCIRIRLSSHVDSRWVLYVLASPQAKKLAATLIKGVGRPRLGLAHIRALRVPVPPLAEQRRIVAVLDAEFSRLGAGAGFLADAKQRLSRMSAALRAELLAADVDYSEWQEILIDEISTSIRNGCFVSRPGSMPNGVAILRIGSVRSLRLDLSDLRYSGLTLSELRKSDHLLEAGDLLFTRYNGNPSYVGACAVVPSLGQDLTYPDKLIRVRINTTIADPEFVALTCSSGRSRVQIRGLVKTTAGQAGIAGRDLKAVRVRLPDLGNQRRIVAEYKLRISDLVRLGGTLEKLIEQSLKLRRLLLAEAFVGTLVSQDPDDEPASVLLERIKAEQAAQPKARRARRTPKESNEQRSLL